MTLVYEGTVFAAVLVLSIGGALAAPSGKVQGASSDGSAGEAAAQVYGEQNGARFAASVPVITSAQTAAARAEGALEGPRASQPYPMSDGDEWTLPGRFVVPD